MSGVTIVATVTGLEAVAARIGRLASLPRARLLDALGALGETQTKRRIASEKTSPGGVAWKKRYGARNATYSREKGFHYVDWPHPLMEKDRHLHGSIHHVVQGASSVRWGSGLIYAAIHQMGGEIRPVNAPALAFPSADGEMIFAQKVTIPARPYLGVSAANAAQMERLALSFIGSELG